MLTKRSRTGVAELLELALADPARAETQAREILEGTEDVWWRSVARHALGLALRENGEMQPALQELRAAVRLADRTADPDRVADVRATLGLTLVASGRSREGLAQLGRAAAGARAPDLVATVLMRRGIALSWVLGRHDAGLVDLRGALAGFRALGDQQGEARTRNLLGLLHLAVGDVATAEQEVLEARELFTGLGLGVEAVFALHNLGMVAYAKGDLPAALATYDRAGERYAALDLDAATLAMDRSAALLAAGLAAEAVEVVEVELRRHTGLPVARAELQLRQATALLAAGDARAAQERAATALVAFRRTGRDWYAAHARLVVLRSRAQSDRADRRLVRATREVAEVLEAERSVEAASAWLLAGRLASDLDRATAAELLGRAAEHRTDAAALVRAVAWLAHGLERELAGDRRGVARACRRGFEALDTHRATLGSSELRALATGHGDDLARLALRHAVAGPPRSLLWWSERWRATALDRPPARPTPTGRDGTDAPLAALRDNARRLVSARGRGEDVARLEAERTRWEREVRRRLHRAAGTRAAAGVDAGPDLDAGTDLDVAALVAAVGDAAFVELVEVEERLLAVVVRAGRVSTVRLGRTAEALRAVEHAHHVLRRCAGGRPTSTAEIGQHLQDAVLGAAANHLAGAPAVVVSPTSRLHAVPWALLPVLAGVSHSVVPSAGLWLRARSRRPGSDRTVFLCGPGLTTGGAEIDVVASRHPGAVVLRAGSATVERSLAALDGAALAHIAAHGHFRQDSPLFSALELDDGPLVVHDFERMPLPPYRVVLSACESGVMAPVGPGELLGLVSALLSAGTAGVVASVVAVNDAATVELMVELHAGLEQGDGLATALLRARRSACGDPVREATAASFLALGV